MNMKQKKTPKNAKLYYCKKCEFTCCKKCDYDRHIITRKHQNETNETKKTPISNLCHLCSQKFTSRTTLWRHKQKCGGYIDKEKEQEQEQHIPKSTMTTIFTEMTKENNELRQLLVEQYTQAQQELQTLLLKQQEIHQQEMHQKILEIASESKIVNYNHNTNNNTINNRFNMNFFLNEQCKDAMNLSDFLNNIEVSLEDVSNVGRLGYADGISRIIINALKDMDVYERPIHCSDIKREIMYIKENDIWEKDDERKYQMKRVLKLISHKNVKRLMDWREAHPGWLVYDSKEEAECLRITNESMGGGSDEENERLYKKMIRKIAHETLIDKNLVE